MNGLTLTVLGSAGTHPGPGRACSSYLVESEGYRLLLDCGNGSLANLQRHIGAAEIDALIVSHLHPDHFADLYGLYYARRFHPDGPRPLDVYAPSGARERIGSLIPGDETFPLICRFRDAAAGDRLHLGPFEVTLSAARHSTPTLASRVRAHDAVLAYSADSAPTPELVSCANDADVFLCEATWLDAMGPWPEGTHMTGAEAGQVAADAGAGRLMVTHVLPTFRPGDVVAEASQTFDGEVLAAEDGQEIPL